jgi:prepilin-type N-terminal cleavage/methylation domain-containing protein
MKRQRSTDGFTLAEVAVTLVIVGVGLVYVLQGINTAKITALHTYQEKVAREMAVLTLGQIESGLYWEEVEDGGERLQGTYADEGYEDYHWEAIFGDELEFIHKIDSDYDDENDQRHDDFEYRRRLAEEAEGYDDNEDPRENPEPYEKVRVRVTLQTRDGRSRELVTLELWIPWEQVYGLSEEDLEEERSAEEGDDR